MTCCDEIKFKFSVDIIDEEGRTYDVTLIVFKIKSIWYFEINFIYNS